MSEHVYDPGVKGLNGDEYHQHGLEKETWEHMDSFNTQVAHSLFIWVRKLTDYGANKSTLYLTHSCLEMCLTSDVWTCHTFKNNSRI